MLAALGFFVLFPLLSSLPAPASAQEAFLRSDVSVDVSGKDATEARASAMKQAERTGLKNLLSRLAPGQEEDAMKGLDDARIRAMVQGTEVLEERIAGNRYRAQLRVSYKALAVNQLIEKRVSAAGSVAGRLSQSTAILVLPVYEAGGESLLWEPSNAWREAWRRVQLETGGGNVVVPYGDGRDIATANAATVQSATYDALAPLINRYGAGQVAVVKASLKPAQGSDASMLEVIKRDVGRMRSDVFPLEYRADPQESVDDLLLRAARDLAEQIGRQREDALSREAVSGGEPENRVLVVIPIETLQGWSDLRGRLLNIPSVVQVELLAIAPRQVDALLHFRGQKEGVEHSAAAAGLVVTPGNGYWVISDR